MVASIRDTKSAAAQNTGSLSVPRPTLQQGDLLLCIHSADRGSLSSMAIQGGWSTLASRADDRIAGSGGGTKVYQKTASGGEPSSYSLSQSSGSNATAVILAIRGGDRNIVVRHDGDLAFLDDVTDAVCPSASPPSGTGSGLDVRAGVGWAPAGSVSWSTPSGYTVNATQQAATVAMVVASRTFTTSSRAGEATFRSNRPLWASHGFTILVPSSITEERPPDPPSFPDFTPARGSGIYRYTVHDLQGGVYRGEINPVDVYFDRRIGEAGTFSATLPIPNERTADLVAEIIPRDPADLTTGPGRIAVQVWRAGALWGEYWINGAVISQSRRGGISIQLRGSTLEAYLHHVPVEQDLDFYGDEIANARSLLNNMMFLSGANIGLTLASGGSGLTRELTVKAEDNTTYGDVLRGYAEAYPGFEYTINPTVGSGGVIERRWEWGAPVLPFHRDHVFVQSPHGGDILDWAEEIDALRGATRIQVRGGTPEVEDASEGSRPVLSNWTSASAHLAAGWPRYGQVVDHPGESLSRSELNNYAQRWITTLPGAVRVYSCTVALGGQPTISPSSLGDWARRIMVNEWYPRRGGAAGFDSAQRLIGIGITPVARGTGKEEAQLILEEAHV